MGIRLLDCTLRDGGHLTGGKFGEQNIRHVLRKLVDAQVDMIEAGFLTEERYSTDYARFSCIADAKRVLPEYRGVSRFCLMADFVNLDNIEPCDGTVEFIRLSFKRFRLDWALRTAKVLMDKGYKVCINPVNCNVYTDAEYLGVLQKVAELHPFCFSIVDTFGVLRIRDLSRLYYLVDSNLPDDMAIGVHLHENLGLAYSLAQHLISVNEERRNIIIDASLLGMGRVPGNLCIEQIMEHLNMFYRGNYVTESAFDAIDDCIAPLKKNIPWGYSIPYVLSAQYNLHRTYAEFLLDKQKLLTSDMAKILSSVSKNEAEMFNEKHIEEIYRIYMSVPVDDNVHRKNLSKRIGEKEIVIIAPGGSLKQAKQSINRYVQEQNAFVIAINFIPDFVTPNLCFYTNIKRYELERDTLVNTEVAVSSNLMRYEGMAKATYIFDYAQISSHGNAQSDDSTLMVLCLLKSIGINKIAFAGFDGFMEGNLFYRENLNRNGDHRKNVLLSKEILKTEYNGMDLVFLTKSAYGQGV